MEFDAVCCFKVEQNGIYHDDVSMVALNSSRNNLAHCKKSMRCSIGVSLPWSHAQKKLFAVISRRNKKTAITLNINAGKNVMPRALSAKNNPDAARSCNANSTFVMREIMMSNAEQSRYLNQASVSRLNMDLKKLFGCGGCNCEPCAGKSIMEKLAIRIEVNSHRPEEYVCGRNPDQQPCFGIENTGECQTRCKP